MNSVTLAPNTEQDPLTLMRDHLASELAGINKEVPGCAKSEEDILFEDKMRTGLAQDTDGRLVVSMPWRDNPATILKNNRV